MRFGPKELQKKTVKARSPVNVGSAHVQTDSGSDSSAVSSLVRPCRCHCHFIDSFYQHLRSPNSKKRHPTSKLDEPYTRHSHTSSKAPSILTDVVLLNSKSKS